MKKKLFLSILATILLFVACNKDEETDPRDKYIGTWVGYETSNFPALGINNEVSAVTYRITKGSYDGQIVIQNPDPDFTDTYTAKVTGSSHVYDTYFYEDSSLGYYFSFEQLGQGTISGNHIAESGTSLYNLAGQYYSGTWNRSLDKQ